MNPLKILSEKEKLEIKEKLNGQFGITEIPGKIFMRGEERLFLYSGNLGEEQIRTLEKIAFLERVGSYLGKIEESGIRLSIEGAQILGNQITKNIFEIPSELVEEWMKGHELLIEDIERLKHKNETNDSNLTLSGQLINSVGVGGRGVGGGIEKPSGFVVIKYKSDFLGTGKASENKISNFIPKNRRLREKSN